MAWNHDLEILPVKPSVSSNGGRYVQAGDVKSHAGSERVTGIAGTPHHRANAHA